jgi:DNA polymerase-1
MAAGMYRPVTDPDEVRKYLSGSPIAAFDFETVPDEQYRDDVKAALDPHKAHIAGVSFSVSEDDGIYVPMSHRIGINTDHAAMITLLAEFAADSSIIKVAHNISFESMFLYQHGIILQQPCYDTIAAAQMTLKNNTQFRNLSDSGLKTLVPELLDVELPSFDDVTNGRHFDELDPSDPETVRYTCADADYTLRLYHLFNGWFETYLPKHRAIAERIESPTAVYCGLMKYNGVLVDSRLMADKAAECEQKHTRLRDEIAFIIGDINIGANASTSAFKKYLYRDLKLPVLKTTAKYQEAADDEALVLLAGWCEKNRPELAPLFKLVKDYRRWGKIKSAYINSYAKHINSATGRIHPQLLPLGTESGRLACRAPTLQNQISGGEINVRSFLIAPPGKSLVELDYSQIEARLAAYLSGDEQLLDLYEKAGDLHAMTTAAVFRISPEEAADRHHPLYKHRRTVAKTTFFGFLYGIYGKSLQRNLMLNAGINTTVDECKMFLENLTRSYPTLAQWQKHTIEAARSRCYAETKFGRRRYFPLIRSEDFMKRGNAERSALNHGVQGLAADLLKLAMARLIAVLPPHVRPLFTVHDSLVFEVPDDYIAESLMLIKAAMEEAPPIPTFDIPIVAEVSVGKNYGHMEEIEIPKI